MSRSGMTAVRKLALCFLLLAVVFVTAGPAAAQDGGENPWYRTDAKGEVEISLHFFYSATCPYCAEAERFLPGLLLRRPWLKLESYEVDSSAENRALFADFAAALDEEILGVPAFFLCGQMIVGFDESTGGVLAATADYCHELLQQDVAAELKATELKAAEPPAQEVALPFFGALQAGQLSLPVLTLVLGGVDAFNPCAFFVLLFLLSLLAHAHSRRRMLLVGGVFVLFSGLLYFVFMAAWLHFFLVLEGLRAVTLIAGLVAGALAVINLKDFFLAGRGPSLEIPEGRKPELFARMRGLLAADSLPAMLAGTVVLALAANTYELLCSTGFPLVYTRALTLNELSTGGYYLYLAFYNLVYVLPLLAIVVVFTFALGSRKLSAGEGRVLKLLSGLMMLGLAVVLVAAPDLLNNGLTALVLLVLALLATWLLHRLVKGRILGS
ncbi:hypothetical protein AAFN88_06915 [Pelagibius sp. CAU 1746]|uniref:hypothetical protein n=1 Tax=Pelagibius sp. CAU 1746 TaxID=3140370 RepID=UPI00325A4914